MLQCVWQEREGGGEQDSVDCKTMWLVGEDPLGLGCDVDSVAGYIQSYCNVLENVDYCGDIVDSVDSVDCTASDIFLAHLPALRLFLVL